MNPTPAPDELEALRRRDPLARDSGWYQDGPLDERAERDLGALRTSAASPGRPGRAVGRRGPSSRSVPTTLPVALAGVLACAVAVTVSVGAPLGSSGPPGTSGDARAAQAAPTQRSTDGAADLVLQQVAAVAAQQPPLAPAEAQFAYVRMLVSTNTGPLGGRAEPGPLHEREVWLSQRAGADGLIVEEGESYPISTASLEDPVGPAPTETYAGMSRLPTDPAALLGVLRADAAAGGFEDLDHGAFVRAGEWLSTGMAPPEVVAALYRATALVPGVVVVPDAEDAAGRRGTGLAFDDPGAGLRHVWVVDETASAYLGASDYLLGDTTAGAAGLRTGSSAVLARGVADAAGAAPSQVVTVP